MNCYGCRFAIQSREHFRHGNQVKCLKAETLFGGERWVNVLEESKCGHYEPFVGDDSTAPELAAPKVVTNCNNCNGTGKITIWKMNQRTVVNCSKCDGKGTRLV